MRQTTIDPRTAAKRVYLQRSGSAPMQRIPAATHTNNRVPDRYHSTTTNQKPISTHTGGSERKKVTTATVNDIQEKTAGFTLVKPNDYDKIMVGDRVRYINAEGKLVWGGWVNAVRVKDGRTYWVISAGKGETMRKYSVYIDGIKTLWKKYSSDIIMLSNSIEERRDAINSIAIFLQKKYGKEFTDFVNSYMAQRKRNLV